MKKLYLLIFISVFLAYKVSSPAGDTPYNYFTRLGAAFLDGKYYLTDNPPWLSELIPAGNTKYYVVYPPAPALLVIPFILLFGQNFPQQIFAHLVGAGIVLSAIILTVQYKKDTRLALWTGLLVGLGTLVWYMSSVGSVWYLGQTTAALFLLLALIEAFGKKRLALIGFLLAIAFFSRLNTFVSLPLYIFILRHRIKHLKALLLFLSPIVFFSALYGIYNFVRFGSFFENGYFLLPKILNETDAPWFAKGVMSPYYILDNVKTAFWSFPKLLDKFPFIQPSWAGLAIWITTPAFIYALVSTKPKKLLNITKATVIISFLFVAMHGGTGFAQFGYRFAVDFYPFLILLVIRNVEATGVKKHHWLLLAISIVVNAWGVVWINKFGWVSY